MHLLLYFLFNFRCSDYFKYHYMWKINFVLFLSVSPELHPLLPEGARHVYALYVLGNLCWARTIQLSANPDLS